VAHREVEILAFGDQLFSRGNEEFDLANLTIPRGERSLAEAEGLGEWDQRHVRQPAPTASSPRKTPKPSAPNTLSLDDARALARSLRNRRDWERSQDDDEES
jgi:hypothetical protein